MFWLLLVLIILFFISNNIIFTIKDTKSYAPVVTLSAKDNQKLLQFLNKGSEFIRMNLKQKVRIKTQQMNIDIFSNQILLEVADYLF